jgi:4-aminobutyrate aminotransferase / (S)-3-amino-2-methylpropionate transaminase / 5-aminovalerate transaminase
LKAERAYESDYLIRCFPHQEDIVIKDAKGTTITDSSGKRYLDLFAGIAVNNVGHCHPKVVAAVREQAGRFMHHSNYYHDDVMPLLAKQLAEVSPKGLIRSYFANSGTEAIDGSVKLAKKYASMRGKNGMGIVSLQGSFHGRLSLTLSLTGQKKYKERLGNYAMYPGIFYAPAPYHFRYGGGLTPDEFGRECAERMEEIIDDYSFGDIAAVLVEPIMGEAGIIVPPDTYLPAVQRICRSREIPLIADEVQTGVGRTGRMFASQHWNIEPSIMAFAKGIGGGLPLGGFIATEELASAFETGDHFSTFGGNPVCCAAGLAVLEVVKEEGLVSKSKRLGDHALKRLGEVAERSSLVGEVRGKGLMIGVELVGEKKWPADREAAKVKESLKRLGFIIGVGGLHKNVLRFQPPLIISEEELDTAVDALESTLRATSDRD